MGLILTLQYGEEQIASVWKAYYAQMPTRLYKFRVKKCSKKNSRDYDVQD